MKKTFSLRFDIDTPLCLTGGLPPLLKLGKKYGVHFTFFVSVGRAISKTTSFKKLLAGRFTTDQEKSKLSALEKLGFFELIKLITLNPPIGLSSKKILQEASSCGHELVLHGGKNHSIWQHKAITWKKDRVIEEVKWGIDQFNLLDLEKPLGFGSPGWATSPVIKEVIAEAGFHYIADAHGSDYMEPFWADTKNQILEIPTNIAGEPGGVGYLEHLRALGLKDSEVVEDFRKQLLNKEVAVCYDHPCYAGTKGIHMVEDLLKLAQDEGYDIVPLRDLSQSFSGEQL